MSDFKHTPGPWVSSFATFGGSFMEDGNGAEGLVVYPASAGDALGAIMSHSLICSPHIHTECDEDGGNPTTDRPEAEANARLIAAAPELLKSLMDSTDELDGLSNMFSDNEHLVNVLNGYVKRNRAVIAKAIGGQL